MRPWLTLLALLSLPDAALADEPDAKTPPAPPGAGYQDGFFVRSPDQAFKLKVRGLVQLRGTALVPLDDTTSSTVTAAVQRAQVDLGGHVFSKQLGFLLKIEHGQGLTFVKDAWVNYAFVPGVVELRAGQWKRPFSRQELTGDARQELVERGLVNASFMTGRDVGVALHDDIDKSPGIEWSLGAFAGGTDKPSITAKVIPGGDGALELDGAKLSSVPSALTPTMVGRFGVNFGDVKGYAEVDTDGGAPRGAVAASALEAVELGDGGRGATQIEVDGILKLYGVDLSGAMFLAAAQQGAGTFEQGADRLGVHTQAGVLLLDHWHPALRYDLVTELDGSGEQHEIAGALSILFYKQNVQLQLDGGALVTRDVDGVGTDMRVRTQLVLAF
ncbi:MAG: hypothetical protein A2138_10110 [Deltaproteobacteria bacterium RBG_16_71_12]|nr:MAG: hypothetical protein A2138_10110 [Deltaproteobacteria bacterium RBG_16_71_12]